MSLLSNAAGVMLFGKGPPRIGIDGKKKKKSGRAEPSTDFCKRTADVADTPGLVSGTPISFENLCCFVSF